MVTNTQTQYVFFITIKLIFIFTIPFYYLFIPFMSNIQFFIFLFLLCYAPFFNFLFEAFILLHLFILAQAM